MDLQLTGKRALVTGSTAGIGFAIACALAAEGAHVTLNGRSRSGVSAAVVRLIEAVPGARVDGVAADLSSAAGCEASPPPAPTWTSWSTTWASSIRGPSKRSRTSSGSTSSRPT
jgi:NADP-dependent 3-hydroxy acid dehydrogenase YdfG